VILPLDRWIVLAAILMTVVPGCADRGPAPVTLVLISPHRDELREEVAIGFREWFAERSRTRRDEAHQAVAAWLAEPNDERLAAARHALSRLVQDWSAADLGKVAAARETWQGQPTPETGRTLVEAIQRWSGPDRRVELVWQDVGGGTSQIQRFVEARYQLDPDSIGIDVLFGGGTDLYERLARQQLLDQLDMDEVIRGRIHADLNGVPLYDPGRRWFGPMLSSFGILCNREVLRRIGEPEPRSWTDLGRPGMRTWVNAGDPRLTGAIHMVYEIILQGEGWDEGFRTLLRLGANTHTFIRDSGSLTRSVSIGEVAAAGNVDVQALGAVNRAPHLMTFILPQVQLTKLPDGKVDRAGGTIINADSIGVLHGAPHKQLATAFVEYTLSDAGQKLFMLRPGTAGGPRKYALCRLSVVEDFYRRYPPEERSVGSANPFTQKSALPYRADVSGRRWDALNDLFGAVIVDAHDDLAAAWKAVAESPLPGVQKRAIEAELFRPPCSEQELLRHAWTIVNEGPRERLAQVNQWSEAARQRYRQAARAARGG